MPLLKKNAKSIFTDSGGVQKEEGFFKAPFIMLSNEDEWIEYIESGWNLIIGTNKEKIVDA